MNVLYASIKRSSWISPTNFTRCFLPDQISLCVCSQTCVPSSQCGYLILFNPTHDGNAPTWRMKQAVCLCRTWASWHVRVGRMDQRTYNSADYTVWLEVLSAFCQNPISVETERESLRKTGSFSSLLPSPPCNLIHYASRQRVRVCALEGHLEFNGFKVCFCEYPSLGTVWFLRWGYCEKQCSTFLT